MKGEKRLKRKVGKRNFHFNGTFPLFLLVFNLHNYFYFQFLAHFCGIVGDSADFGGWIGDSLVTEQIFIEIEPILNLKS